jgi:O-acetyl-ADP-ribose deacetylase (regulator of RNase III)
MGSDLRRSHADFTIMFTALIGDLFESPAAAWVNAVNCVGVMGKGVALEFKKRFPAMFESYRARCSAGQMTLGEPYLYRDASGRAIVNFPTKGHWRSPSRLADIERGLDFFAARAAHWGLTSVAMPSLGCGNGGLEWAEVGPLIWRKLHALPIDVDLYAPRGTPESELGLDFLSAPSQMPLAGKGRLEAA